MGGEDPNDPFLTHKKPSTFLDSFWGKQQPKKVAPPPGQYAAGGGKGYKFDGRNQPPGFAKLFGYGMLFFIVTALSFTLFWELNKVVPVVIACIMLSTVFDQSALGDMRNRRGEDINGLLPALNGTKAIRVWLYIVITWLAVFLGGVTGMNAEESYMSQFYAITFFREYENVLASTPGAAYSDAGKVWFAESSKVDPDKSIGFKEKMVYCAAPIMDKNQGRKSVAFWAIGFDCCDAKGKFQCGASAKARGGVRAPPDGFFAQDNGMFLKAVNQAAAVNGFEVDEDVILLHWVEDPDHEARSKFLTALGADFIGAGLFALLIMLMTFIGLSYEAREESAPRPADAPNI